MLFKKENKIHKLLMKQIDKSIECFELFSDSVKVINQNTTKDNLKSMSNIVSNKESEADNIRHEIIRELLGGALLPVTRREIKILIEKNDKIPNKCEEIIKQIMLQGIKIEKRYKDIIIQINEKTKVQLSILKSLIDVIFKNLEKSYTLHYELVSIADIESQVDKLESEAIENLYNSDFDLAYKNQLKTFITDFAEISDIIEDISDTLEMIMVIRKV